MARQKKIKYNERPSDKERLIFTLTPNNYIASNAMMLWMFNMCPTQGENFEPTVKELANWKFNF